MAKYKKSEKTNYTFSHFLDRDYIWNASHKDYLKDGDNCTLI